MNYTAATVRLARGAGALLMVWLLLSGALLAVRSLLQALPPLRPAWLLSLAIALVVAALLMRSVWTAGGGFLTASGFVRLCPLIATSVGLALWGWSLARGGSSLVAGTFFWLILAGEEGWAWRRELVSQKLPLRARGVIGRSPGNEVLQQLTRLRTPKGEEIVRGWLAITIESGSRAAAGHVAFCPPFAERPHFELQPSATENVTFKLSQLYPHGARIEARRGEPAAIDTTLSVQYVARVGAKQ